MHAALAYLGADLGILGEGERAFPAVLSRLERREDLGGLPGVCVAGRAALAGFRRFYFVDSTFNLPASHAIELCREIARRQPGVEWRCILYPHEVSEPLATAMAAAGCVEVSLGFESGSPAVLARMNKRYTPDEVRRVSGLLASHGIRRHGFLLLGGPGETPATVEESLAFAGSLELDSLKTTVGIRIYPGTPLARLAVNEGQIAPDDDLLQPRFYLAQGLDTCLRERGLLREKGDCP